MWAEALLINLILTASKVSGFILYLCLVSFSATWGWHYYKVTGQRRPDGDQYWKYLKTGWDSWNMQMMYYFSADKSNSKVNQVKDFIRGPFRLAWPSLHPHPHPIWLSWSLTLRHLESLFHHAFIKKFRAEITRCILLHFFFFFVAVSIITGTGLWTTPWRHTHI